MKTAKRNTVRIEIGDEYGSGFCYFPLDADFFYIVTARHVLYGDKFDRILRNTDVNILNIPGLGDRQYTLSDQDRIISLAESQDLSIILLIKAAVDGLSDQVPEMKAVDTDFGLIDCAIIGFPFLAGSEELRELMCDFRGFLNENVDSIFLESKRPLDTLYEYGPVNAKGLSGAAVYLNFEVIPYLIGIVTEFTPIDSFIGIGVKKINELLTREGLPNIPTTYLVVDPAIKTAIRSFNQNNRAVGSKIRDKIGNVHVPRLNLNNTTELLTEKRILIIDGNAGAGKSAFAKSVVVNLLPDHEILMFSGEQLSFPTLDLAIQKLPIPITVPFEQLLENPAFKKNKIIWVESVEKLIETNELEAFAELLGMIDRRSDIKIILTIRTYVLHLFHLRLAFSLPKSAGEYTVQNFTDAELSVIETAYPAIQSLLARSRLSSLLHVPFYLTYAVQFLHILAKEEDLDEAGFRRIIWNEAIRKGSEERGVVFEELSVKRAKEMGLYTRVEAPNTVIDGLHGDNLIYFENDELRERYCPAHDVLEDWALMRYIYRYKRDAPSSEQFFRSVGNKPAIRRAFRLWLGEALQNGVTGLTDFIRETLGNSGIDNYWKDEVYVSILRSAYTDNFFSENGGLLLQNNQYLAHRFINFLKTACKEKNNAPGKSAFPILVGGGWGSMVKFLYANRAEFVKYLVPILYFLLDWQSKCYNGSDIQLDEGRYAGLLTLYILDWLKGREEGTRGGTDYSFLTVKAIPLAFSLTEYIQPEMEAFLKTAEAGTNRNVDNPDYLLIGFYEKVTLMAIEGIHCSNLCQFLPDQVIEMFKRKIWIKPIPKGRFRFDSRPDEVETHFGLEYNYDYKCFAASIYQTPVYWLFKAHTLKALKLIVEVMNYCTSYYISSGQQAQFDLIVPVKITLNEATTVTQMGNSTLWQLYRGSGQATPYVLQSMLMSLEQALFDLAESGHSDAKKAISRIFNFLFRKSTSAATTSVLASVALRFPGIVGEAALPLYTTKYTFLWEFDRAIGDLHMRTDRVWIEKAVHDEEREKSDALPHRSAHNGISSLILYQSGNNLDLRGRIFDILDIHHSELGDEDDVKWHKILTEIDLRKWQPQKIQAEPGKVYLTPNYEGKAKSFVEEGQEQARRSTPELTYWSWMKNAYDKKNGRPEEYQKLKEAIKFYRAGRFEELVFRHPGILATVGLRDYKDQLEDTERDWCIQTIGHIVRSIIQERYLQEDIPGIPPFSYQDTNACFSFLPFLLFSIAHATKEAIAFQQLYCRLLLAPLHDHEIKKVLVSARHDLWTINPEFGNKCFNLLIAFGSLIKEKTGWRDDHGIWDNAQRIKDTDTLIEDILKGHSSLEVTMTLDPYTSRYYSRALAMVPAGLDIEGVRQFVKILLEIHLETFQENGQRGESASYFQDRTVLSEFLPEMMLAQLTPFGETLIDFLYDQYEADFKSGARPYLRSRKREFIDLLITNIIRSLDNSISYAYEQFWISNFWKIWQHIHARNKATGEKYFTSQLLLNIEWQETATHWKPLNNKGPFLSELIEYYGTEDLSAVLNLLSSIGDQILMPLVISLVVKLFHQWFAGQGQLYGTKGVKFVKRAFYKHGAEIKRNRILLDDFLFLLDKLADHGSSEAYFIREDMITFRVPS